MMIAPSSDGALRESARGRGGWTAVHGVGMWLIGLGFGMGWAHQYTKYPALWGAALAIAGCVLVLLYSIANRSPR